MTDKQTIRAGMLAVEVRMPIDEDQRVRIEKLLAEHSAKLEPVLTAQIGRIVGTEVVKR